MSFQRTLVLQRTANHVVHSPQKIMKILKSCMFNGSFDMMCIQVQLEPHKKDHYSHMLYTVSSENGKTFSCRFGFQNPIKILKFALNG